MLQTSAFLRTNMLPTDKKPSPADAEKPQGDHKESPSSSDSGEGTADPSTHTEETVTSILDRVGPDFPYDLPI